MCRYWMVHFEVGSRSFFVVFDAVQRSLSAFCCTQELPIASPGCSFRKIEQSLHALEHPEYLSGPSKMDEAKDSTQQAIFAHFAGHWAITNLE